ncbi:phosphodiester glycosidase family protein [bacterium]|nr:phosphodiester glycosidase family protein [bacterium]
MKKTALLILTFFILSNIALAGPFCIKEPVCVREPEQGLYLIKINTKQYSVRPYVIEQGFDTSENVFKNNKFELVVNGGYFDFKNKKTVSFVMKDEKIALDPMQNEHLSDNPGIRDFVDLIYNRGEIRRMDCGGEIKYDILKHYDLVKDGCKIIDSLQAGPILYPENKSDEEFFTKKDADGNLTRNAIQGNYKKPRTAVAIKNNNVYFIIATREHPMTLDEIAEFGRKNHFEKVLNLDGGGSTSFTNAEYNIKSEANGTQRRVKSFLVVE